MSSTVVGIVEKALPLMFETPEGPLAVTLSDRFIKLFPLYGKANAKYYYLPNGTDWDALSECIVEQAQRSYIIFPIHSASSSGVIAPTWAPRAASLAAAFLS